MAFKDFNAGDIFTASDVDTYLMGQAVIACDIASHPPSAEGRTIAETDTGRLLTYFSGDWRVSGHFGDGELYTPVLKGSTTDPTMGSATTLGRFWRVGRSRVDIIIWIKIGAGFSAGSGSYAVTLPVPVHATYNRQSLAMTFYDQSGQAFYRGFAHAGEDAAVDVTNLNTAKLFFHSTSVPFAGVTNSAPVTPASGDIYEISGSYYI